MPAPTDPRKPPPEALDELDLRDESTDAVELNVDLDPGAPEPAGVLGFEEENTTADAWLELHAEEPVASTWLDELAVPRLHLPPDDLEDFATQEELPILPWSLDVELLQLGIVVPAVLDPTAAHTTWTRPGPPEPAVAVTLRIRMLDVPASLIAVDGSPSLLRIGRDVLAGRVLIAVS